MLSSCALENDIYSYCRKPVQLAGVNIHFDKNTVVVVINNIMQTEMHETFMLTLSGEQCEIE